jgi:hypothetical protein
MTYSDLVARIRDCVGDLATHTDQAKLAPMEPWVVATTEQIAATEQRLGHKLPPLLAQVYREIGNGGFGPGYGMLGIVGGTVDLGDGNTAIDLYEMFRTSDPEDPAWTWPAGLLPVCDWGCAIRSCIDCTSSDGPVITFDPNSRDLNEPMDRALVQTHATVGAWFEDWVGGVNLWDVMFEDDPEGAVAGVNPFTKQPFMYKKARLRRR